MTERLKEIELLDDSFANSPLGVHYHPERIYIESREPQNMDNYHIHGHVEINLPFGSQVDYLINGREVTIAEGHLGIFWAANPHLLVNRHQCHNMMIAYIPIHTFLAWPLDDQLFNAILNGATLCSETPYALPQEQLAQWIKDFLQHDENLSALVSEELQIMLRRISFYGWTTLLIADLQPEERITRANPGLNQVQGMLDYIAHHYNTGITTLDIAGQVGLHPNYAMNQFKKVMRISIKKYIHRMRINYAKALLFDTNRSIIDIAMTVGFTTNARFYDIFKQLEGIPPKQYRIMARQNIHKAIPAGLNSEKSAQAVEMGLFESKIVNK